MPKDEYSLFAVSLIKQSFDQSARDMRVINFFEDGQIEMTVNENGEDEWFMTEMTR